jgi:hypothetical protein
MPKLFTVSFTTKKMIRSFDKRGKIIGEVQMDTPVTITALPSATAASYAGNDNYKITDYQMDDRYKRTAAGSGKGVGNGTRTASYSAPKKDTAKRNMPAPAATQTAVQKAAASGDLSSAISNQ